MRWRLGLVVFLNLLPWVVWSMLSFIPALAICRRAGKSQWWATIALTPFVGAVLFMFVVAFTKWNVMPRQIQRVR